MKYTACKQVVFALCFTALAWPVGAVPTPSDPSPPNLPPTHIITPSPMALQMRLWQAQQDENNGVGALRAKKYKEAETDFRNAIDGDGLGTAYCGLAECLLGQGRRDEAMQIYQMLTARDEHHVNGANPTIRGMLEYAILLSQAGKWAEAVSSYQSALPNLRSDNPSLFIATFDPDVPQPKVLEISAHIALGQDANYSCNSLGDMENDRAFEEYGKALALMPDSPATNYFYGLGWQNLDPKDRVKMAAKPGQREAVKAALEKAAKLGTEEVQTQAKKELGRLR